MKKIGILKSFDNLGRLVIPKEFRERYAFDKTSLYEYFSLYWLFHLFFLKLTLFSLFF